MHYPHHLSRRLVLVSAAGLLSGPASSAGPFPQRPVTIVVPTTPGGTADILARLIGQKLSKIWGQPVVVENKPGAGSLIGAEYTARAAPDGHTLMFTSNELASLSAINNNARIDVSNDLSRIGRVGSLGVIVLARPSMKADTLTELIATMKASPGKYTYSSNGQGSILQLFAEMFKREAKVDILHVPFRGAPEANRALIAGDVDMMVHFASGNVESFVTSGRVKAYAVASDTRLPGFPTVPTTAEAGLSGFRLEAWYGLFGPAKMDPALAERINRDLGEVMKDPDVVRRLAEANLRAQPETAASFDAVFREESKRWTELIKSAGIQSSK